MAPNILLSFVLIRTVHPHVLTQIQHHGWTALVIFVSVLLAVLPIAAEIVDYGAEGWLWALLGLMQRMYVDDRSVAGVDGTAQISIPTAHAMTGNMRLMRLLACFVAAVVYIWQEQTEFSFSQIHFAVFIVGVGVLSLSLCLFQRGTSRIQPPESIANSLRFIGRRTLEIYAIQLAGSELLILLMPDLAP